MRNRQRSVSGFIVIPLIMLLLWFGYHIINKASDSFSSLQERRIQSITN